MLRYAFLLGLMASSQAWVLRTNVQQIVPGNTHNVQLECKYDTGDNGHVFKIDRISRIRITKLDCFGSKKTFAEIRQGFNSTSRNGDDINVTGKIDKPEVAFLKVTWSKANVNTVGAYGCEVNGYDSLDNFGNVNVNPQLIKEKVLSVDEVRTIVQSMVKKYEEKQITLERENVKLKADLEKLQKHINTNQQIFKLEIEKEREYSRSTFVTKIELFLEVGKHKNSTRTAMMSRDKHDSEDHTRLEHFIQGANTSWQAALSEYSILKTEVDTVINTTNIKQNNKLSQLRSKVESVMKETKSMDSKYTKLIDDLRTETRKNISEAGCSCPTKPLVNPVSTTSRRSTTIPQNQLWPRGNYGLVRARSGCPAFGTPLHPIAEVPSSKYIKFIVHSGSTNFALNYCVHDSSTSPSSSLTWPRGFYCIVGPSQGLCPSGFNKGYTKYDQFARQLYTGHSIAINYCCRSDGSPNTPIVLPSGKAFYLFRFKGTCQKVQGMSETEERVSGGSTTNGLNTELRPFFSAFHPDFVLTYPANSIMLVRLCLYQKFN